MKEIQLPKALIKPNTKVVDEGLRDLGALLAARHLYVTMKDGRAAASTLEIVQSNINRSTIVLQLAISFLYKYATNTVEGIDGLLDFLLKESGLE
ncbi:MAG: hypothetical protein QXL94_02965 [Candidatus Parvarchaeum sp.]